MSRQDFRIGPKGEWWDRFLDGLARTIMDNQARSDGATRFSLRLLILFTVALWIGLIVKACTGKGFA